MNAIDVQGCDDARHLIQAELDRSLRSDEVTRLHQHLGACADCRGYRAELAQVQSLLQRAGHFHGHPPHNAPDLAHSVTQRLRRDQPRRMLFSLAQATAQFGGLALVAVLALNSAGWVARSAPATQAPAAIEAAEVVDAGAAQPLGQGSAVPMRIPESEFDDGAAAPVHNAETTRTRTLTFQTGALLPD